MRFALGVIEEQSSKLGAGGNESRDSNFGNFVDGYVSLNLLSNLIDKTP